MLITTKRYRITTLTISIILALSTFIPALAYAQPLAVSDKDWQYVNGNSWAWNYSPQTQINKDNVDALEVQWIFPIGGKTLASEGIQSLGLNEGSTTPPIVIDGVVYVTTNWMRTYAIDAKTGKQIWVYDYTIDVEDVQKRLPLIGIGRVHLHGFRYWEGGDALLLNGMACDFYGIDPKTGEEKFWVKDLCLNVPGNIYNYKMADLMMLNGLTNIGTYEKGRQFTYVLSSSSITRVADLGSRHVTMGIDMDTHQILWRVFGQPPSDKLSKDWALQECDIGFFQDIPCSQVAAQNRAGLEWDWAFPGEKISRYSGVSANWGQAVIDEDTGIFYTQTGNQAPYGNMTMTPGPRVYGSTIMAIDMNQGKLVWWLQPFPRDPYDYDCNWSGILVDHPTLGKVYMKGCKEGRLYVMDAATGKPHYVVDVADEQIEWGQITSAAAKEMPEGVKYHLTDPFSYSDLREWKSITDGMYCTAPCEVYPHWSNGIFASDMSYDPETQTLYHYAAALQSKILAEHPYVEGQRLMDSKTHPIMNTTIVARDIGTGNVKWTWFWPLEQQRSHMVVTPELLFTGFKDGYMKFFDKDTGELLREMNLGHMVSGATTGQDSDGKQMIFTLVGVGEISRVFPKIPGALVALGLSERAAAEVKTTTITTTTATTTTAISSTTVTETVEEVGLITYAAVAIAVIAIIAAAILATRRRP